MPAAAPVPLEPPRRNEELVSNSAKHVALTMDGAGRWGQSRGLGRAEGQAEGVRVAGRIIQTAVDYGLSHLTLHAFSVANWERPESEIALLMKMVEDFAVAQKKVCVARGIRVAFIGDVDELRTPARRAVEALIRDTAPGEGMTLTLALSYGSMDDIVQAVRAIAARARAGLLLPEDVDTRLLHQEMTTRGLPPVDLLIKTGGSPRLGDFLVLESIQAHVVSLPEMWPEFTPEQLLRLLDRYAAGQRLDY